MGLYKMFLRSGDSWGALQESQNPTPSVKICFEKPAETVRSGKDALPSSIPGSQFNDTVGIGTEF